MEEEEVVGAKDVVGAMAATEARLLLRLDLDEINQPSMATCRLLQTLRRRAAVVVVVEEEGDVVDPIPIVAVAVLPLSKHRSLRLLDFEWMQSRWRFNSVGIPCDWLMYLATTANVHSAATCGVSLRRQLLSSCSRVLCHCSMPTNKRKRANLEGLTQRDSSFLFCFGSGINLVSSYLILLVKQAGISRLLALLALCAALILRVFALSILRLEGRKRKEVTDTPAHSIPHGKRLIHVPCQDPNPWLHVVM